MKTFIENIMRRENLTQTKVASRTKVSQSTINNILSGVGNVRDDIKIKIATGFNLDPFTFISRNIVSESPVGYGTSPLSADELRLLKAFRSLDERRKERCLETVEDMALALRSGVREGPGSNLKASNSK